MKKLLIILAILVPFSVEAIPTSSFLRTVLPEQDSAYELGTSTRAWSGGTFDKLCLTTDICITSWPAGSLGIAWPFTKQADNSQGTTTVISFLNGFLSTASSSVSAPFRLPLLSNGGLGVFGGHVISAATTTAGTGLTYSGNAFNCNTADTSTFGCLTSNDWNTFNGKQAAGSYLTAMSFAFPFTKQADNSQGTSTLLSLIGGFESSATSSITANLVVTGNIIIPNNTVAYQIKDAQGNTRDTIFMDSNNNVQFKSNGTGGVITFNTNTLERARIDNSGGFLHLSSTTLQNFTATNATTSQATTTNFAVSSLTNNGFIKTYGGTGNFSIDTNTYLTSAITALTGSYPVKITTGSTPTISLDFSTTTANPWSLLQNFNMSSSTVASFGNAYFGKTATSSFDGTGALTVIASSTLQNFTGVNSTTTNATSTNFYVSGTLSAANVYDTGLSGATCVGESNGVLGTANCVSSVNSAGNTLTVSPTTGAVDVSLKLNHANDWTTLQTFTNATSTLFSSQYASTTILCLSNDCRTAWPSTAMSFAWPFTKQADGYHATSTGMLFSGGFVSTASTTIGNNTTATGLTIFGGATSTGEFLHLGSTTLQKFTANQSTTTQATSTNFSSGTICLNSDCRTAWPTSGGSTFAYPFTKQAGGEQSTSTVIGLYNGFLSLASSSVSGLFQATNASSTLFSTTIASTSQLQLSGKKDALLSVDANGWVVASSSIGNNQLQNNSIVVNTAAPLGGAGTIALGGTVNLTCTGCLTSAVTAVTGTYPIKSTNGSTPAISLDFSTTTANSWSLLNQFNLASSSALSAGFASFGRTATTTINGQGDLFVTGSTTLQNFTAQAGTTTGSFLHLGSTTLQVFAASAGTTTSATSTNLYTGNFLATASTTLQDLYSVSVGVGTTSSVRLGRLTIDTDNDTKFAYSLYVGGSSSLYATSSMVVTPGGLIGFGTSSPTAQFSIHTASSSPTNGSRQYVFSIGSTTLNSFSASNNTSLPPVTLYALDTSGRTFASSTRPTVTLCGTTPSIAGTDSAGRVTVGAGPASGCQINFSRTWGLAPYCTVNGSGTNVASVKAWISLAATTTATTLNVMGISTTTGTVSTPPPIATMVFMYHCYGDIE